MALIMKMTTLCYIEKDDCYLMMHRIFKEDDINKDKWIGVGGHFEEGESPEECVLRETFEETGLSLISYQLRGIVTFVSDQGESEYMYLYTATDYKGELKECDEGLLKWVPKNKIGTLNLWEGDKVFLDLLGTEQRFFSVKLQYQGEQLVWVEKKIYQ